MGAKVDTISAEFSAARIDNNYNDIEIKLYCVRLLLHDFLF